VGALAPGSGSGAARLHSRMPLSVNHIPAGRQVACRPFAWEWADTSPPYKGVRRGEVVGHAFRGSREYGGVATWTIRITDAPVPTSSGSYSGAAGGPSPGRRGGAPGAFAGVAAAGARAATAATAAVAVTTVTVNSVELRAALDLRHALDCRGPPVAPPGWVVCLSRSTGEYYFASEGSGSQWHVPGLNPRDPAQRPRCRASCGVWGHRSKINVVDHRDRMERIRRNFEFKVRLLFCFVRVCVLSSRKIQSCRVNERFSSCSMCGVRLFAACLQLLVTPVPLPLRFAGGQAGAVAGRGRAARARLLRLVRGFDPGEQHVRRVPAHHRRGALGRGAVHHGPPCPAPRLRPHCLRLGSQVRAVVVVLARSIS